MLHSFHVDPTRIVRLLTDDNDDDVVVAAVLVLVVVGHVEPAPAPTRWSSRSCVERDECRAARSTRYRYHDGSGHGVRSAESSGQTLLGSGQILLGRGCASVQNGKTIR
jgi:hypothetical protein